jgi:glycosyltransferase involved in cell wall biosynthesis
MDVKKKLWIVTELFYPDETSTAYILTKIANYLTCKYCVNVICGSKIYDKEKKIAISTEIVNSIKIIRKRSGGYKNNLFSRLFSSVSLSIRLCFSLLRKAHQNDTILLVTNPPMLMILVTCLLWRRNRLIILVHDIFPENTIPARIIKSHKNIVYKLFEKIFNKAYAKADTLITLGTDMHHVLEQKILKYYTNTKIKIIQNWAEVNSIYPLNRATQSDQIRVLFAGNLGLLQGLEKFLSIIAKIKNPLLLFIFAGTGVLKQKMTQIVNKLDINNVIFKDAFLRSEQISVLNDCELSLVSILDEMYGLGVPSKAYNIMAAGKPILFIGNEKSEIAEMVIRHEIGFVFSFEQENAIIDFFNNLSADNLEFLSEMGIKSRETAEKYFSENVILDKFLDAI